MCPVVRSITSLAASLSRGRLLPGIFGITDLVYHCNRAIIDLGRLPGAFRLPLSAAGTAWPQARQPPRLGPRCASRHYAPNSPEIAKPGQELHNQTGPLPGINNEGRSFAIGLFPPPTLRECRHCFLRASARSRASSTRLASGKSSSLDRPLFGLAPLISGRDRGSYWHLSSVMLGYYMSRPYQNSRCC